MWLKSAAILGFVAFALVCAGAALEAWHRPTASLMLVGLGFAVLTLMVLFAGGVAQATKDLF